MRLHDVTLHTPDGPVRIDLHRDMTVFTGLDADERRELADRIVATLAGTGGDAELRYVAIDGERRVLAVRDGRLVHHPLDDPSDRWGPLTGMLFDDEAALRRLVLVGPERLEAANRAGMVEPPELVESRRRLDELEAELDDAIAAAERIPEARLELKRAQDLAHTAEERRAQAAWREAQATVDALRAELATSDDPEQVAADERVRDAADDIRDALARWHDAADAVGSFEGETDEIEPDELPRLLEVPREVPADLDDRLAELDEATQVAADRQADLRHLAADGLPEPSDPVVAELARHDQEPLWACHERLDTAQRRVDACRHRLEGLSAGDDASAVQLLEEAHARLVAADDRAERWFLPATGGSAGAMVASMIATAISLALALALFAAGCVAVLAFIVRPRVEAKAAALAEAAAAQRTGSSTYLGFHLRRLEASLDRDLSGRLEAAELEWRLARQDWVELTGGIDHQVVAPFEMEVRAFAAAIERLGDRADELQEAVNAAAEADDRLAAARADLIELAERHQIDDPPLSDVALLRSLFEHQRERRLLADRVLAHREARADLAEAGVALAAAVDGCSLTSVDAGRVDAGVVGHVEERLAEVEARVAARAADRSATEIEAELAEAVARADACWDDGWDEVTVRLGAHRDDPIDDDDIDDAIAQAQAALDELIESERAADRIAERRNALHRRVVRLENALCGGRRSHDAAALEDAEARLQELFTAAAARGPARERLPIIVDDAFVEAAAARKWDLLEMLRRLSEHNQVLYLTDDAYVMAWAKGACDEGRIRLVSAVEEDEVSPAEAEADAEADASVG